jgi:hypothetical protein
MDVHAHYLIAIVLFLIINKVTTLVVPLLVDLVDLILLLSTKQPQWLISLVFPTTPYIRFLYVMLLGLSRRNMILLLVTSISIKSMVLVRPISQSLSCIILELLMNHHNRLVTISMFEPWIVTSYLSPYVVV